MKIQQVQFNSSGKSVVITETDGFKNENANLVLAFGERTLLEKHAYYNSLKNIFPNAAIVICSTSGQIADRNVINHQLVANAIEFEKTDIKALVVNILENNNIADLGHKIKTDLITDDLKSILVLSEGSFINGTALINEIISQTNGQIPIFGGIAGDEAHFEKTIVGLNCEPTQGQIVVIGFYGNHIQFGFGCESGWLDFGPEREVTLSNDNVLYKIGDRFALDLYKEYLGKYAEELPGSSLYFPLSMKEHHDSEPVVRTILSIDEERKSMTFAGNIPQGSFVRLMRGNLDKLIDASYDAASKIKMQVSENPQFAFVVSCVGRKIVLGNRIEEEVEIVKDYLGQHTILGGFYSYGEFSPNLKNVSCELHNQTMTITVISEN
uniref:FIST signal transduction protein n=2 Tax=Flavobacterium sp. TaxID=239 RepID=UPI00404AA227